jgi:hypothetical protein
MAEFTVSAVRSPNWDDAEVKRRLSAAYRLILSFRPKHAADGDEDGDQTPLVSDALASESGTKEGG